MRAEEVEPPAPDGRSVRSLINVTPMRSGDGELVSVVVAMQNLAPFEDLEPQGANFPRMAGHELRAPIAPAKGSAATVLESSTDASRTEMLGLFRLISGQADHMRGLSANLLDAGSIEAVTLTAAPEPTNVVALADGARTTFLNGGSRHPVPVELPPGLPLASASRRCWTTSSRTRRWPRRSRRRSGSRRCARARTWRSRSRTRWAAFPLAGLPRPFRKRAGLKGGTGIGLSTSKEPVEAHGGRIRTESGGPGLGARFTFTLPAAGDGAALDTGSAEEPALPGRERTRSLVRGGLDGAADGRSARAEAPDRGRTARSRPARPGPSTRGRHRPHAADPAARRTAGDPHCGPWQRQDRREGARLRGRPHRQAVLADRTRGADPRSAQVAEPARGLGARRTPHPLRPAPRDRGRPQGGPDSQRVRVAARVLAERGARGVLRPAAAHGVVPARRPGDPGPVRTYVKKPCHKLDDDAASPGCILTERGAGCRMPADPA